MTTQEKPPWRVKVVTLDELEATLNEGDEEGYSMFELHEFSSQAGQFHPEQMITVIMCASERMN